MNRRSFLKQTSLGLAATTLVPAQKTPRPNIVFILADDIGYGDLSCYGAKQVSTPNLDRLAKMGLRFTDAHTTSATCTPSRYAIMTGEYPWRKPGTNVLPGDAKLIIDPAQPTLPRMLQSAGYKTGCVGKWHLGLGNGGVDWNGEISPGPLELGFDESFIIPATGDRVPCVYIEGHRVVGLNPKDPIAVSYLKKVGDEPTGKEHPEYLKMPLSAGHDMTIVNGISRIGYMSGGHSALWVDEDMAGVLNRRALKFIDDHHKEPFFLYFATHDIHVPRVPSAQFRGTSHCGVRCDVIRELDDSAGQVLAALEKYGLMENTIIIFSSDNGAVVDDGYADGAAESLNGHKPSGPLRGGKYSVYEGGTRVPFSVTWKGKIQPGVSDAMISQVDLLASFAAFTGSKVAAKDSQDISGALFGKAKTARTELVEHAGARLGLRQGQWKYAGAGGNQKAELFDLSSDPGETKDLSQQKPQLMKQMAQRLAAIRAS